jgi:DNA repair protein RecN (Recombination protein N)
MIKSLKIKNYALIKDLEMQPHAGFNTITGETGAGKSIMLGAIGLLLGNRADTKALFNSEEKCIVEAIFDLGKQHLKPLFDVHELDYSGECILRREISPAGKSRAFINDTPVTLDVMKEIGSQLVDIHSQSDTLLLGSSSFQLQLMDAMANTRILLDEYRLYFKEFKKAENNLESLQHQATEIKKEADYHHFLLDELQKAALSADEQELLEEELRLIENAGEIKSRLEESIQNLQESEDLSIIPQLQAIRRNLESLTHFSSGFGELAARVESCWIELRDICDELNNEFIRVEFDPERAEALHDRLGLIYKLQQKHDVQTVSELLAIQADLALKVERVLNVDEELTQAEKELERKKIQLYKSGEKLSIQRKSIFNELSEKLVSHLKELGMPHAVVQVAVEATQPGANGMDDLRILFSANRGVKPEELKNVASGGEFSRLMFAIKYILAEKTAMPTIIFDEIDTGISGEIALRMVKMMAGMAKYHQVISITHLPQIAAWGQYHFYVYKDDSNKTSVSRIRKLKDEERSLEIAKMIGGDQPSSSALDSARELLASAKKILE